MKKRDPEIEQIKFGSRKPNRKRTTMTSQTLELPADTLLSFIETGLRSIGQISDKINPKSFKFSEMNSAGKVKVEFIPQVNKEVKVKTL